MEENQNFEQNPELNFDQSLETHSDPGADQNAVQNFEPEDLQPAPPRRRRKRTKWQDFKEAYLPVIIIVVAVVLIVSFIAGAIGRRSGGHGKPDTTQPSVPSAEQLLQQEQKQLLDAAELLASQYDYQSAMSTLSTYSAGINTSDVLMQKYKEYEAAFSKLVPYSDINAIPNLSFRLLIEDLPRALADEDYGSRLNSNYITTTEFSHILQQLYANGYMLVSMSDIAPVTVDAAGKATVSQGTIYLPEGKKPLVMTQIGVNYFTYLVDGDGDGLPDKNGSGFPSRLILDASGKLTNEMVDADGNVVTGSFDLVTILDDFIAAHPDFSYRGARATLAVTGYDGLFGYRTDPESAEKLGKEVYEADRRNVVPVINKLREEGYDLAYMSYNYDDISAMSSAELSGDLEKWTNEVKPLLGDVNILVYPYGDISDSNLYTGKIYDILSSYGFTYFVSLDSSTAAWGQVTDTYARMMRREVGGENLHNYPQWYKDLFDPATVLESTRVFE